MWIHTEKARLIAGTGVNAITAGIIPRALYSITAVFMETTSSERPLLKNTAIFLTVAPWTDLLKIFLPTNLMQFPMSRRPELSRVISFTADNSCSWLWKSAKRIRCLVCVLKDTTATLAPTGQFFSLIAMLLRSDVTISIILVKISGVIPLAISKAKTSSVG